MSGRSPILDKNFDLLCEFDRVYPAFASVFGDFDWFFEEKTVRKMNVSPNFTRKEFACKCGCGFNTVDVELIVLLEMIRKHFKNRVFINSGCRCNSYNKLINGKPESRHLIGQAADIRVENIPHKQVQQYLKSTYSFKYGIGCYDSFTHIDVRNQPARW